MGKTVFSVVLQAETRSTSYVPSEPSWGARASFVGIRRSVRGSSAQDVRHLPIAARAAPWQDLVAEAHRSLRCIDWQTLVTPSTVMPSLLHSGPVCGGSTVSLQANEYFSKSRLLEGDETIDFFLSHSWHDNADDKQAALTIHVKVFARCHGREPTFWLDKVCIDQTRVADGLRVLPVNVMACAKMLVLLGPTYPTRLWCVWELFTLLAFNQDVAQASDRLEVLTLGVVPSPSPRGSGPALGIRTSSARASRASSCAEEDEDVETPMGALLHFQVARAHCYDPNEEAKLRGIIDALGRGHFDVRVQKLARALQVRERRTRPSVHGALSLRRSRINLQRASHVLVPQRPSWVPSRRTRRTQVQVDNTPEFVWPPEDLDGSWPQSSEQAPGNTCTDSSHTVEHTKSARDVETALELAVLSQM